MSDKHNNITVYRTQKNKTMPGWEFHTASPKREWMDEYIHMYRCLPMTIANQNGWVIPAPCNIQTVWFGGQDRRSMHFWLDADYNVPNSWVKCHFVGGVITFEFDFMVRTSPGTNLLVRGAPNFFINGAVPLEGVVESDWLNYSFTMNWKVTETNKIIYFKKGDPICFIQPIPHNYSESFDFNIDFLENNPELHEKFHAYHESRFKFKSDKNAGLHNEDWQRHYFNGVDVKTGMKVGGDMHAIKLNLKEPDSQNLIDTTTVQTNNHADTYLTKSTVTKFAYEYLLDHIKTDTKVSDVHGVGTFAIRNIRKGEQVFVLWRGETKEYTLTPEEFTSLPIYVQNVILKSYENTKTDMYWFKLHNNGYFNLANPHSLVNTAEENGNVDSRTGTALRDISEGEEILGTYKLEYTKPKLEVVK